MTTDPRRIPIQGGARGFLMLNDAATGAIVYDDDDDGGTTPPDAPAQQQDAQSAPTTPPPTRPSHRSLADLFGTAAKSGTPADGDQPRGGLSPRAVAMTVAGVLLLIVAINALMPARPAPAPPTRPTVAVTTPTSGLPRLPRAIIAYAAPDGAALGAIEPGRAYAVREERPDGWRRLDVAGSGEVWVRGWELDGAPPTPTATPVATATPLPTTPPPPLPAAPQAPAWVPPPAPVAAPAAPEQYCASNAYANACSDDPAAAQAAADQAYRERRSQCEAAIGTAGCDAQEQRLVQP
jgi:hypothetical protein